jgi:uncharacterized protein
MNAFIHSGAGRCLEYHSHTSHCAFANKLKIASLGLGMYQHDLSEKELDEKLHFVSVDAVATVGVDANSCSVEILQKVPGLTKLAEKIVKARPLKQRNDLLKVAGLGPKTFENCAAFCRVVGPEPLDATLVHPESYNLARWLLKERSWTLSQTPKDLPPRSQWKSEWASEIKKGTETFQVSSERVLAVIDNLVDSMTNVDPRLKETTGKVVSNAGSIAGCVLLSPELAEAEKLKAASPLRGIVGTVRNIADFGCFVDFGAHNDGLLHTSKLGPLRLQNLLIGQQIGVDILSVNGNQVSLALAGLGLQPDPPRETPRRPTSSNNSRKKPEPKGSAKRSVSTQRARGSKMKQPVDKVAGSKRSISTSRADARPSKKSRKAP